MADVTDFRPVFRIQYEELRDEVIQRVGESKRLRELIHRVLDVLRELGFALQHLVVISTHPDVNESTGRQRLLVAI